MLKLFNTKILAKMAKYTTREVNLKRNIFANITVTGFELLTNRLMHISSSENIILNKNKLKILSSESKAIFRLVFKSFNSLINEKEVLYCKEIPKNGKNTLNRKDNTEKSDKNNKKNDNDEKLMSILTKTFLWIVTGYLFVTLLSLLFPNRINEDGAVKYVSWNEFVHHMLAVGEVKELIVRPDLDIVTIILHDGAIIKGKKAKSNVFHMSTPDSTKFDAKLRDVEKRLGLKDEISMTYDRSGDTTRKFLVALIVLIIFASLMTRIKGIKGPISMDSFSQMGRAKFTLVDPFDGGKGILFKDVAGLQEAKQEVMEFVDYLKSPEKYQRLGAKVPKGALLLGPPGCGKTLLAKAVATEAKVPFLSMNGSEFIEMIGGLGAARVRDLFKEGRKRSPCIIYIDEIDAIGRQRSGVGNLNQASSGESEQTLNQLLVELDGMSSKEGVLMLASTNRADILDKALLRPGRFDRHILIDFPNLYERKQIFEKHLSGIVLKDNPNSYSERLARLTPGFSGADIANIVNEAALHAARSVQKSVNIKNLEYAVERLVGGTEKRSNSIPLCEKRIIAFHESGHALVGWLLPYSDVLLKVTIVSRTNHTLGFAQYTPTEQQLYSKEELLDKMCMTLGGRAAESIIFNKVTTGGQNDLEKVTKIAYAQIKKYGMNSKIGPMYIADSKEEIQTPQPFSRALGTLIDNEASKLVAEAYERTKAILESNKSKLIKLSEALLEKETLNYNEIVNLIGPPLNESNKKRLDPVDFEDGLKHLTSN